MRQLTSSSELCANERLRFSTNVELDLFKAATSPCNSSGSSDDDPRSDIRDDVPRTVNTLLAAASAAATDEGPFITSSSSSELC